MTVSLFDAFDRVCIINLPHRADRRHGVERELARQGVRVDGTRVRFFAAIRPDDPAGFPGIGARGCYLSHLEVLREARADGVRRLLVLEDDVMFTADMSLALPLLDGLQHGTWHMAYPGHVQDALPGPLRWHTTREPLLCAHCYAVNGDALDVVIGHLEACLERPPGHPLGGPMHVDGALTHLRQQQSRLITLRASRSLAGQRSSRSDIIGPSWLDRLPFAGAVRAARNQWRRSMGAV
jgi:hypothetical protein